MNADLAKLYGLDGVSGQGCAARRAEAGESSRRRSRHGRGAGLDFAHESHQPDEARQVGAGRDFWQSAPAAAGQCGHVQGRGKEARRSRRISAKSSRSTPAIPTAPAAMRRWIRSASASITTMRSANGGRLRAELDTSGKLPGGEKFAGVDELKKVVWSRRDQFVRNIIGANARLCFGARTGLL